ncbi:3-deoxy-D-manno-octulosonic acid kinase [Vibrio algicola]|uniref:3-deoxy-D-manno-octulosonic acid kinase n=1 Tax=Vibrio algicola TaxID=2662262 RepID=A0A5Q0TAP5_9VIBR|nr:3-deoxy-D-manno-octulosonic acid kinase [Vibrio algicola]
MNTLKSHNQIIWYNETLISDSVKLCCDPEYWQQQGKILGSAQGRGTTWFVQTETLPAALRHYRRGGLFGKLINDSYWFSGWDKTRSYQEFILLEYLIVQRVNVPQPIAARSVRKGLCYQADILTQKIPQAQDLVGLLQINAIDSTMYEKIGQEVKKLHQANVNHTDLNIHNILIDQQNMVWIIDFDKCHIEKNNNQKNWKQGNIDRLLRSFQKELKKRQIHWKQTSDWQAFLSGYTD